LKEGRCGKIKITPLALPSPTRGEGNTLKIERIFLPLDGGGEGGVVERIFQTFRVGRIDSNENFIQCRGG
jgi:hypothetical protein